ncbi:zinc-binding dehydrogenase [Granulicella sp. S190]|uniref:zinc-binding dehydrogenase n=1 Tax=Granulicella sp. S190 TaxID=1747226 RepID=UPI00131CE890|nr:zinc-binding dehydrogenase [Granulicella sp. S190]
MRAIVLQGFGGLESLAIKELPDPEPTVGQVLIAVRAFGINHAETHMRKGEWAEAAEVSGIECVGEVVAAPGGEFQQGDTVAAIMGGLGRTINGSYAELTVAPATNVIKVQTRLSWENFAVLPESYATAWTCLYGNLKIQQGETLLLRGATSALGQAALNIAANAGVRVIATTRNEARFEQLRSLGAARIEREGPRLAQRLPETKQVDAVLDLVGNSTLLDSLAVPHRHGRVCLAGWLGGLDPVTDFNPLLQMASGVHFSLFGSFVFGTEEFPLTEVPMQQIVNRVEEGIYQAKPAAVFNFDQIREAQALMESNGASGKIVVKL